MKIADTIALVKAGFTREEIKAMDAEPKTEETAPPTTPTGAERDKLAEVLKQLATGMAARNTDTAAEGQAALDRLMGAGKE